VYGAEPEYAMKHRDEMLYDVSGTPYSIENLFYVMNIHAGNPWRAKILVEMARAVREVPFDGLHLDQYGFPKSDAYGPGPHPRSYDLAEDFPPFIDDARRAIRHARPDTRVIFNAVDNWPIATVAPTSQDATYIEVWPPYENYSDLQMLILEARRLAPTKQVILAAYLSPLQGATDDALPPAERATRLASAAIWANGGFHLLMGERNGALCHPYYPQYATLMPDFAQVMRRCYDFVVRYENVLGDKRLTTLLGDDPATVTIAGHPCSSYGEAGAVWTIRRSMPGFVTLSLINLSTIQETHWNAPKPPVGPLHDLTIDWVVGARVTALFVADPDGLDQSARALAFTTTGEGATTRTHFEIPRLDYWTLIVARVAE
ncbi:MAG TPA: glycoside hydrolase family 66 protein, partial [Chloroflexota bacterium]|nr:glycoside hydrolase family 66 protein [Chloroflexota bacterium]